MGVRVQVDDPVVTSARDRLPNVPNPSTPLLSRLLVAVVALPVAVVALLVAVVALPVAALPVAALPVVVVALLVAAVEERASSHLPCYCGKACRVISPCPTRHRGRLYSVPLAM